MDMNCEIVDKYWKIIDCADFDKLRSLFCDKASIHLPNTKEVFNSINSFIEFNKDYPGRWHSKIIDTYFFERKVIAVVKVWNEEESISFYVTSIFEFENGKILIMKEYWSENSERPDWRENDEYTKIE